jgi:hypothetical protein
MKYECTCGYKTNSYVKFIRHMISHMKSGKKEKKK